MVVCPETKYKHSIESLEEYQFRFPLTRLKGETITISGKVHQKFQVKGIENKSYSILYTTFSKSSVT